ncbi:1,4-dihydroxy-2-naphthoate polyprenyltransferase [Pseudoglutamicibacter cumminsii]|uniref:1,4-dihydroxy-2-naphthoate polyprenyltransferase n=1 Tax=Pseudoglutamicibacter cumminsii TaxID=156979 RepID=UPI0019586DA8|nr:1,4-dihydroxy-2-naphthoate octaprenyltransferase [Pseudoglutamicibacter cumminsii]
MATASQWISGARLRTLPMAVSPVVVGVAAGFAASGSVKWIPALLALVVSLLLQIGVNYANDYSDGVRGTDDNRVGPFRLTGSAAASPRAVKYASFLCFGLAAAAGLGLVWMTQTWVLLIVGALAIAAAWGYTGGKNPYGYLGLGELFVFIFFGLVATVGTTYTQLGHSSGHSWLGAISIGLIATALLMVNNIRDLPTDRAAGKRTLAVRVGDRPARLIYVLMIVVAILGPVSLGFVTNTWLFVVLLTFVVAFKPCAAVLTAQDRRDLIPALATTSLIQVVFAVLFSFAVVINKLLLA